MAPKLERKKKKTKKVFKFKLTDPQGNKISIKYVLHASIKYVTYFKYTLKICIIRIILGRPNDAVVRAAGCCTKGPQFESRVRHGCPYYTAFRKEKKN